MVFFGCKWVDYYNKNIFCYLVVIEVYYFCIMFDNGID